jgi:hypothetical protein
METIKGVKYSELQLADVVILSNVIYGTATVKQIKDGSITFFRPYVHTEDFSYGGGVICYIGIEEFTVCADSSSEVELLERKGLK